MNEPTTQTRSVIIERDLPFPTERIWRALTQPHLIEEWLMKTDFKPIVDQGFSLRADWGVVDCRVIEVEPTRRLSYTWEAMGLESVVTWTLTPNGSGTLLRMEHSGFRADQERAYQGATYGWQTFLSKLEQVVAQTEQA